MITNNEPGFEPGTGILSIYGFNDDCCTLSSQPKQSPITYDEPATAIGFSANGKLLAVATAGSLFVYPVSKCCTIDTNIQPIGFPVTFQGFPSGISFSPNNTCVALSFPFDNIILVYPINADCSVGSSPIASAITDLEPMALSYFTQWTLSNKCKS